MAKTFDVVLIRDHHDALSECQYGTLGMTNKIEEQDFRTVHGEMVQVLDLNNRDGTIGTPF